MKRMAMKTSLWRSGKPTVGATILPATGCGASGSKKDCAWNGGSWIETNEVRYVYDGYRVIQERHANNLPQVTCTRGIDLSSSLQGAGGIGGLLARTDMGKWIGGVRLPRRIISATGSLARGQETYKPIKSNNMQRMP